MENSQNRTAVSTTVFAGVTIVLIIIAAAGFGLYATKTATTVTETSTMTSTMTASSAASTGSSELLVAIWNTNAGDTLPAPSVTVTPQTAGATVTASTANPPAISPGNIATYGYTITGAVAGSLPIVVSITNNSGVAYDPNVAVVSSTPGAVVTPASANPTSISASSTQSFHFTVTGGGTGLITISLSFPGPGSITVAISI